MTTSSDPEARFDRFIEELRDELSGAPSTEAARQHVIRAVQTTGWSKGIPSDSAGRIRWRKRLAFGSVFSGALAKFVGVGVALAATTAGVGATGVLPDEVQDPIAQVAQVVGIDLPDSRDDEPAEDSIVVPGVESDSEDGALVEVQLEDEDQEGDNDSQDDADDQDESSDIRDDDDVDQDDNGTQDQDTQDQDADADDQDDDEDQDTSDGNDQDESENQDDDDDADEGHDGPGGSSGRRTKGGNGK